MLYGCLLALSLASGYSLDYTEVHNIAALYRQMGRTHLGSIAGSTGKAHEILSGVGLGSANIHITGLVGHWFVRLA